MHTYPRFVRSLADRLPAALLIVALAGCTTLGPDYHQPRIALPAHWSSAPNDPVNDALDHQLQWWRAFQDPLLDTLIAQALAHNQDINIAWANLRQARAERIQIAADAGPTITTGGSLAANRSSKARRAQTGGESRTWQAGFDASWELDIFGGTRRAVEAADADIDALRHDQHALQVSLAAEIAADYVELRYTQARLAIAHDNIHHLHETEKLTERALRAGLGTAADVMQARAEREAGEAQPPLLEADIARLSHAIGVLAGGFPGDWRSALAQTSPTLPTVPAPPLSLPSDLIRQRPDLQASERRLAAATAQIGVKEADRFPRFVIPLGIGTAASLIHDLLSAASLTWSAGLQASQNVYDGDNARAGVKAAEAQADAARLIYERDVRLALRDVEDALTALQAQRQRQRALAAAVDDSQAALEHSTRLYQAGLSGYLPVLTALRTHNQARDTQVLSLQEEARSTIALYKALGTGWRDEIDGPRVATVRMDGLERD